jgi:hypothetical protein
MARHPQNAPERTNMAGWRDEMSVTADRTRNLALGFPGVNDTPHWHPLAFRTPRKNFATLDADARDINLMFDQDHRNFYCEQAPYSFMPVPGDWGQRGATRCDLETVDEPLPWKRRIGPPPQRRKVAKA